MVDDDDNDDEVRIKTLSIKHQELSIFPMTQISAGLHRAIVTAQKDLSS